MDDVAFRVDEDVAVVAVLELEEVADQGIGSEALDEVLLSLLEPEAEDLGVVPTEVLELWDAFLQSIDGGRVRDEL